ncbi:polymorphic toxin type 23 domain-containing protein [Chryseobacterium sp. RU33C]|uniref:polymorphic toxin type 23 domain-containing protein n=1 Tax=Chryseobacterium sp. RU33C TaxID=1907398 RepID=UPI00095526B4|nr:polymorphic toxin type 23 domain-containing protein [Chryseobacterium sp. RU33C]SIP91944.1 toxin 23 [Chryseobacterium sp. RU33C]
MRILKYILILFPSFVFSQMLVNQTVLPKNIQIGVAAKAIIEFQYGTPNIRFGISTGIGYMAFNSLLPALNAEYTISYGGLSTYQDSIRKRFSSQLTGSLSLTSGFNNEFRNNSLEYIANRNKPLYYFTDLTQPSLQNPFNSSFTFGTNWVYHLSANIPKCKRRQRVGFLGFKIDNFQFGYLNDGGWPIAKIGLGDKEDRYYTGGGFVNINLPMDRKINNINAGFYRFTGYSELAFDTADEFLFGYVDYADPKQKYFNHGFWNFGIGNAEHWNGFIRLNNVYNLSEVQNIIHYLTKSSYHQNQRPFYISAGGSYIMSNLNLSNHEK